jgi:RNA polymerase sigma factor (sigma-70 family)
VDDADSAADVVQETFLLAHQRVRQLRDPARLGSWLYAIARNECLARLRARKRTVVLTESYEPVLDTDPGRALHADQVRELVHAASAGMNDGDREVFELTVRHGLSAAELGRVLDISDKHAHARISRVRSQFEAALGALVLARDGRGRCDQLDAILGDWDGQLTALLRKRIERHVRDCELCTGRRRERMDPAGLLAGYAALPFLAVAARLWPRLQAGLGQAGGPLGAESADRGRASRPDRDGSSGHGPEGGDHGPEGSGAPGALAPPVGEPPTIPMHAGEPTLPLAPGGGPAAPRPRSTAVVLLAAAAAVVLIVACTAGVRLLTLQRPPAPAAQAPTADPRLSPQVSPANSPATAATTTPAVRRSSATTAAPPVPFTLTASAHVTCGSPNAVEVVVKASRTLGHAVLFWRPATPDHLAMHVSGSMASATVHPAGLAIFWHVEATAADGRTAATPEKEQLLPCF